MGRLLSGHAGRLLGYIQIMDTEASPASAPPAPAPSATRRPGCVSVTLGILLVLVGIPMLVCPGPGAVVIASGVGMIAVGLGVRRKGGNA